jgi:hypothetical protein
MSNRSEIARKGRARGARPFCFVAIVSALVALAAPAAAQATLPELILDESNPASPGASLSPRIKGRVNEGETKVVHFGLLASGFDQPIARAVEPNNTARLYTAPGCTGPLAGEGTVGQLEGEGIQVAVGAESVTTFYAIQDDGHGETSSCSSQGFSYRQVSSAPAAPSLTASAPASPANDNFPRLIGNADPEASIAIYPTADCGGGAVATGSGAVFASPGIQVVVTDNSETSFSAKAAMAGFSSSCSSASLVYREVTPAAEPPPGSGSSGGGGTTAPPAGSPPPAPRLRTVPGGPADDNSPLLTGSAPGASTVKVFSRPGCVGAPIAKGPAGEFVSPGFAIQVADNATAVFSAISVSGGGESPCSDPVLYVEDSTAPHTRITMGPAAKTAKSKAVFRFTDTSGAAPGTTFFCKVDKAKWKQCSSPFSLRHLRPRRHLVQVKAVDPAGNAELKPARRPFKVIRHP